MGMGETLQDILTRLEARLFQTPAVATPASLPPADWPMVTPQHSLGLQQNTVRTPHTTETGDIPAEVFLENLGFFTPSSKRIRGIYTKAKVVGTRIVADGTTHTITTKISANHELGLPITADLDYYRAFLKILADTLEQEGRLRLPLVVPTKQLLRYTGKTDGVTTRHEVRTFLKKMVLTGIEGGVYEAKRRDFTEGFVTTVFRQVVVRGETLRHGQVADTNYVWPAPWFLANYLRGYVRRVDLAFHNRLRKPIAKALYPLLATGWYASGGHPYEKRYAALCAEFLLREERYLSKIQEQLDPAHAELQREGFLHHWAYRQAADAQEWVLVYWPGDTFFHDPENREVRRQRTTPRLPAPGLVPPVVPTDQTVLLEEVLLVCGDRQNTPAYRKALRNYPEALIRMVLAETRQAANEHRIGKSRGAFFFDTLRRLSPPHVQSTS
jgi:hypothetical protein